MRSRLESEIAFILDSLNLKWEYEKHSFLLSSGKHYFVDFYIPELKTWLEAKGDITPSEVLNAMDFTIENKTELILLSKQVGMWFSVVDGCAGPHKLLLGKCYKCGSYFFCGNEGIYHCRKCGFYDGMSLVRNVELPTKIANLVSHNSDCLYGFGFVKKR